MNQRDALADPEPGMRDVPWFPWACSTAAVLVIPGGLVVPWEALHTRVAASAVTFALAAALVLFISGRDVFPQKAKTLLNGAIGGWFVLNVLLAALARDIASLTLGLGLSALASVPFLIAAALALRWQRWR